VGQLVYKMMEKRMILFPSSIIYSFLIHGNFFGGHASQGGRASLVITPRSVKLHIPHFGVFPPVRQQLVVRTLHLFHFDEKKSNGK
jgi:hypothetical protein